MNNRYEQYPREWDEEPDDDLYPAAGRPMGSVIQTQDEYGEMLEAEGEGRACHLMACYLCDERPERSPLRGVTKVNLVQPIFDKTETYTLTCGHTIL